MMDQRTVVMIDGQIVTADRAVVSVFDRGFLYGDSVYEVMRTYGSMVFALEEHIERLFLSARRVFIDIPVSAEDLRQEIAKAVEAAEGASNVVRVHVTRGVGPLGLDTEEARSPARVILVAPLRPPTDQDYRDGIGVALVRTQRTVDNTEAAGAKVGNYLVSLLAVRQARLAGAKEAIIVDGRGRVLEGATSNVFVVHHNVVLTPPDTEGILSGITRSYLLRAAANLKTPVRITTLTAGDLMTADEMFISSTTREVLPVVRVDGATVGTGRVGPMTRAIHAEFRRLGGIEGNAPGWAVLPGESGGT